jgi:hypothetical protein
VRPSAALNQPSAQRLSASASRTLRQHVATLRLCALAHRPHRTLAIEPLTVQTPQLQYQQCHLILSRSWMRPRPHLALLLPRSLILAPQMSHDADEHPASSPLVRRCVVTDWSYTVSQAGCCLELPKPPDAAFLFCHGLLLVAGCPRPRIDHAVAATKTTPPPRCSPTAPPAPSTPPTASHRRLHSTDARHRGQPSTVSPSFP